MCPMAKSTANKAQQIAKAALDFEQKLSGRLPKSVSVVMGESTLVITLQDALSPAERWLAKSPEGAAQVQEFYRQLFHTSVNSLQQDIERITGVDVHEATAELEPANGAVVQAFASGTVVQIFLLKSAVPSETWSGSAEPDLS